MNTKYRVLSLGIIFSLLLSLSSTVSAKAVTGDEKADMYVKAHELMDLSISDRLKAIKSTLKDEQDIKKRISLFRMILDVKKEVSDQQHIVNIYTVHDNKSLDLINTYRSISRESLTDPAYTKWMEYDQEQRDFIIKWHKYIFDYDNLVKTYSVEDILGSFAHKSNDNLQELSDKIVAYSQMSDEEKKKILEETREKIKQQYIPLRAALDLNIFNIKGLYETREDTLFLNWLESVDYRFLVLLKLSDINGYDYANMNKAHSIYLTAYPKLEDDSDFDLKSIFREEMSKKINDLENQAIAIDIIFDSVLGDTSKELEEYKRKLNEEK